MLIRYVGGAPFIISDELYNATGSNMKSWDVPTFSVDNLQRAFTALFAEFPAILREVLVSGVSCPAVVGWNAPILNDTTWLTLFIAATGAGMYTGVSPTIPVGGTNITYPDGSTGLFSGTISSTLAESELPIYQTTNLYHCSQTQTLASNQYDLPEISIMVLPSAVVGSNDVIDVTGIIQTARVVTMRSFYIGGSTKRLTVSCGVANLIPAISSLTKLNGYAITNKSDDPYLNILGDPSTTGGGHGTGDFSSDTIAESDAPTITAIDSGFISVYSPSLAQLNSLANYMWTSSFETNLKKLFGDNAMGTIIGLGVVPVTPPIGGSRNVVLGNVDTGVPMPIVTGQYVKVDCGSITLLPKYDAFLDYEPYTGVDLFLPYIGTVQLSVNDVMGKTIKIVYLVDVISGACVAEVLCNGSVYYTFNGCCLTQFPVTNNDYSNVFHSAIQAAISLSSAIAGAFGGSVGSVVSGVAGAANSALNAHPVVNRSGSVAGSCGAMGVQVPYLIMSVPKMVDANAQNTYIGYPNFTTVYLSSISGYTEVENINITGLHATQQEQDEIKKLLKEGVIF